MEINLRLLIVFFSLAVHGTIGVNPDELTNDIRGEMVFSDEDGTTVRVTLWPEGIIPYKIIGNFDSKDRELITNAMNDIQNVTCIHFVPRTDEPIYIRITSHKDGCYSSIGYVGKSYDVNLEIPGCVHFGVILHELSHAIGLMHEHSRNDRDDYVKVNRDNIQAKATSNFDKYKHNVWEGPYNYDSLMHYSANAFSKNGLPTLEVKDHDNVVLGQRRKLSESDITTIKRRYRCDEPSNSRGNTHRAGNTHNNRNGNTRGTYVPVDTIQTEGTYSVRFLPNGQQLLYPIPDNTVSKPSNKRTGNRFPGSTYTFPDTGTSSVYGYGSPSPSNGYYSQNIYGGQYIPNGYYSQNSYGRQYIPNGYYPQNIYGSGYYNNWY